MSPIKESNIRFYSEKKKERKKYTFKKEKERKYQKREERKRFATETKSYKKCRD